MIIPFFFQLCIIAISYIIVKELLVSKLQDVLENRHAKTTKLKEVAQLKMAKVQELKTQYQKSMGLGERKLETLRQQRRQEMNQALQIMMKDAENQMKAHFMEQLGSFQKDLNRQKETIFAESSSLSQLLLDKIRRAPIKH